jgi:hypothetical protein
LASAERDMLAKMFRLCGEALALDTQAERLASLLRP